MTAPKASEAVSAMGATTVLERSVVGFLGNGGSTIDALRLALHVSRREIEEAVENLRLRGEPIVADNDGLHLATDPDELAAYVEARRRRIASIYMGNRALRRTTRRMRERTDLTLFGEVA